LKKLEAEFALDQQIVSLDSASLLPLNQNKKNNPSPETNNKAVHESFKTQRCNPKLNQNFITLKTHLSSSSSFPLNIMFHTNPIKRIKERNSNGHDNINFSISIR
jgi:hypothetical protein